MENMGIDDDRKSLRNGDADTSRPRTEALAYAETKTA